ncbi:MAG: FAD-binding oxidoreductase [Pseudomonadota bacterium]
MENYAQGLVALNEEHSQLDARQMKEATGSEFFVGGLYTPGCVLLQPSGYIRGFAHGLRKKHPNLSLYENTPALTIEAGTPHRVHTDSGSIQANQIILTVNGHLESFGWYQRQLMHVFTYASMTRELNAQEVTALGGLDQWGLIPGHPMGTTVRRLGCNRIVIRNTFTYNPDMRTTESYLRQVGRRHEISFRNRFPMLPAVTMDYCWGGHLCLSRNSVSVFGEIESKIYAACCHNGLGTTKGTLGGACIVDLALDEANETTQQLLNQSEPARLYTDPLMSVGANAYLKWHHWRAGRDL